MFVQHVNHAPMARLIADRAEVAWGGGSSVGAAAGDLGEAWSAAPATVVIIGPMPFEQHGDTGGEVRPGHQSQPPLYPAAPGQWRREIDWLRIGAALSDRGMLALRDAAAGLTERKLANLVERSYVALGGTCIHFFGVTSMARS